ncbi:MAG: response regulator [Acidimicrobiales bacterium]
MLRVVLVDDQELVRTGFRMILESEPDFVVVGEAADGREAVELLERCPCDVVLMDIRMPRLDGVEATAEVRAMPDAPKVLILTTFDLDDYVFQALRNGASGFLLKDTPADDLVAAIRVLAGGDALLAPSVTRRLIEEFQDGATGRTRPVRGLDDLTERELEVLIEVAKGKSNVEIGEALFVGEATVKTHVGRVLSKLGVRDRVQAVVLAYESGLVTPGADT